MLGSNVIDVSVKKFRLLDRFFGILVSRCGIVAIMERDQVNRNTQNNRLKIFQRRLKNGSNRLRKVNLQRRTSSLVYQENSVQYNKTHRKSFVMFLGCFHNLDVRENNRTILHFAVKKLEKKNNGKIINFSMPPCICYNYQVWKLRGSHSYPVVYPRR